MNIIIVGGGIGGLTAALVATHFGHNVTILEQAPQISEVGAGLQLSPNAMKVFRAIDAERTVSRYAFRPSSLTLRNGKSGSLLGSVPLGFAAEKRWGAPYLHIHRADLVQALLALLNERVPNCVKLNAKFQEYRFETNSVSVLLEDGQIFEGDLLIGADGLRSSVRSQIIGAQLPQYTGDVAWRAVVPVERLGKDAPEPAGTVWIGENKHAITYRLGKGNLVNFVGVTKDADWSDETWNAKGRRVDALNDFAGWHRSVIRIIEQADELYKWAIFSRPPLSAWTDRSVALLGDAAHPMPPYLAQGAAMAIEDAWAVISNLSNAAELTKSLVMYQTLRKPRTDKMQSLSAEQGKFYHLETPAAKILAESPSRIARQVAERAMLAQQDQIYGYDVTKCSGAGSGNRTRITSLEG